MDFGSGNFGAPITDTAPNYDEQHEQQSNGLDQGQNVKDAIDANDPKLTSEAIDVNTEGDAYAVPAPPPDGKYRAKLNHEKVTDDQNVAHDYLPMMSKKAPVQTYLATALKAIIIDQSGKYDGLQVFDRWVGTFLNRNGSTKIATILARLKKADGTPYIEKGRRYTHKEWMELFLKALATEPEIGIETTWEWSCEECGKEAKAKGTDYPKPITGMNKFPYDSTQKAHRPELQCQVNKAHGYTRARAKIAGFLSIEELVKATAAGR